MSQADEEQASRLLRRSAHVRRCARSVRQRASLGGGNAGDGARGAAHPTGLREAVREAEQERRKGRPQMSFGLGKPAGGRRCLLPINGTFNKVAK